MSLIIATGSNLGDSKATLKRAQEILSTHFEFVAASRIYVSKAVDYENQPDFFNQVLEFRLPAVSPANAMKKLLDIEKDFGRNRDIPRGPRTLDLDILFWNMDEIRTPDLTIPHPRWMQRSFVIKPLQELPFFQTIEKCFTIPKSFTVDAHPIG